MYKMYIHKVGTYWYVIERYLPASNPIWIFLFLYRAVYYVTCYTN